MVVIRVSVSPVVLVTMLRDRNYIRLRLLSNRFFECFLFEDRLGLDGLNVDAVAGRSQHQHHNY